MCARKAPAVSPSPALGRLCWLLGVAVIATLVIGLGAYLLDPGTGMFRRVGVALIVGFALPALNLASFAANLLLARRARWTLGRLNLILIAQGLGVGATAWLWGGLWLETQREQRANERWRQASAAAEADDPARLEAALADCGARCAGELDRFLLVATARGAHRSIAFLLARGADPTPPFGARAASLNLATCEGLRLSSLSSLSVAVASADRTALSLLLPRSDAKGRRGAAWLAARLDRLELLQRLLEAGVPLAIRGEILDENLTLLNAAASGAALRVAAWLLDEKGFDAGGDPSGADSAPGETPLVSLVRFAAEVPDSPRLAPFLALLLSRGADIEKISPRTRASPLRTAIALRALAAAEALVAAGASPLSLTDEDRASLEALRRDPPRRSRDAGDPDCLR
jgi:hypothetical protein